ncbi:MAG TPA: cell division protein ZapA, partial [Telluria sp.]
KEGEERTLKEAVAFLDGKMCAVRDAGKVKGNDRIAVMAALSVAAEFLSVKSPQGPLSELSILEVKQKIDAMHTVLDSALTPQENLF